jgi:imidazolonepropionase-like amidohydrolase
MEHCIVNNVCKNFKKRLLSILSAVPLFILPSVLHSQQQPMAIIHAKVYTSPDARPMVPGTILIDKGKILAVGPSHLIKIPQHYRIIEAAGKTITAGFWNCHVHFIEPHWRGADSLPAERLTSQLTEMLTRWGFTYVFDLAVFDTTIVKTLQRRIASGEVAGPLILSVGVPFVPKDGNPFYIAPLRLPDAGTPTEASAHVNAQISAGAHGIKIWSGSPTGKAVVAMPDSIIRAAALAAHASGRHLFAHPTNLEGVRSALRNGVDVLAHVSPDGQKSWESRLIREMVVRRMALIPTLSVFAWELERDGVDSVLYHPLLLAGLRQVRNFYQGGGEILFGTDVGYMPHYDTRRELELLGVAGLSYKEILAAMTTNPARRFGGPANTGKIQKGAEANLVILGSDPAKTITAFSDVRLTMHRGMILYRKEK